MKHTDITPLLEQLAQQAAQCDRRRGEHHQPLFDQQLFHCQARLLLPCVNEARTLYQTLIREQQSQRLTDLRAEHLTERLLAQMTAIQRELATQTIRSNEIKHKSYYRKPINQLYQDLAQHNEWELRLKDLVAQKNARLEQASPYQSAQAQQALLVAEQRLERCQQAKLKIEKQITFREQHDR